MMSFLFLGLGIALAAIGACEAVRSWSVHGGWMQELLGIGIGFLGAWMAGVAVLRLFA